MNNTQYLITKALFLGLGFKVLLMHSGPYIWLAIIIGTIIGLGINYLIKGVNNQFITFFSSGVLLTLGLGLIIQVIQRIYLDNINYFVILLPLVALLIYTGNKKQETIFRVSNIIIIFEVFSLILLTILLIPNINFNNYIAHSIHNYNFIHSSFLFAIYSTFPNFIFPNFKKHYNYKTYLISCLTLLLVALLMIGVMHYPVALLYDYPEYALYKRIYVPNFIENIENILFLSWILVYFPFLALAYHNIKSTIKKKN